ncbi:hypothetical protein H2248_001296 [Termitomyces sp. 'cryptogamus']|nr:hypothetical protein H2248_001296 [Termitomyces sp. 'cryptogamus']
MHTIYAIGIARPIIDSNSPNQRVSAFFGPSASPILNIMTSSTSANANANSSTVNSTHLSSVTSVTTISPTWAPPKSPLSPHRLAKLANALGVSTPMPATHQTTPFVSRSFLELPGTYDAFRPPPTPSTAGTNFAAYPSTVSKYLLHVIPPMHLPHDTDNDTDMTPPPASASGYHTHFRRGILVPVHSNLQFQLNAIAKEYALPSTAGMILYLVSSVKSSQSSPTPEIFSDETDEPGPRLSEDTWRHLWTRILKAEQRDDVFMPPQSRSRLGMSLGTRSTPYLPQESNGSPLRPFLSSGSETITPNFSSTNFPPSPTTPSTIFDLRSNNKSAPPSESSTNDSETPATSLAAPSIIKDPETDANLLDLPGLTSPSIIPILAKVEFDIDLRKATWYEPWLRSRRLNHAKRAENRNGRQASQGDRKDQPDGLHESSRHIGLLTGSKEAQSTVSLAPSSAEGILSTKPEKMLVPTPMSEGYQRLNEDLEENSGWSDDSADEIESTARVATLTLENHKDALADIFGTDAETWAEMRSFSPRKSQCQTNPNIVDLALNAADLTALPSPTEFELVKLEKEEDEVQALLDQMAQSTLSVSIPTPPSETESLSTVIGNKKHVPPPLTLVPSPPPKDLAIPIDSTPSSPSSSGLAYLHDDDGSPREDLNEGFEKDDTRVESPAESLKREGAVFDDFDLGSDPTEDYDESDPNDRRHSQFLMKAQLDEIERTMTRLSPRILQDDLSDAQQKCLLSFTNPMILLPGQLNADFYPPSPELPQHPHPEIPDSPLSEPQAAWPATSFTSIKNVTSPRREDAPPAPPRVAVNGVTTSAPKSFIPNSSGKMSEESELRKRELEEQQGYRRPQTKSFIEANSEPIIPLSPDPFGRFASTPPPPPGEQQSSAYWEKDAVPDISNISAVDIPPPIDSPDSRKRSNSSAASRFSTDSITSIEANSKSNRPTLMSVNTIKKLWRKNAKNASSAPVQPSPDKPDEPPKNPRSGRISPQLPVCRSPDMLPPPVPQTPSQQLSVLVTAQQPGIIPHSLSQPSQPARLSHQELAPPVPPKARSPISHPQRLSRTSSQHRPPIARSSQQLRYPVPPHQQVTIPQQYVVPPLFDGTSTNPQPIVATRTRSGRSDSSLDHFQFDQETPYPITTRRTRANSRPTSPPILSPSLQSIHLPPPTPTSAIGSFSPVTSAPPQQKPTVRKSILKGWKSSSISSIASMQPVGVVEAPTNTEQPNANGARPRRPSIVSFGSLRNSVTSPPQDIPPSPRIPQQFIAWNDKRQSIRSKLTNSSIDLSHSPPQLSTKLSSGTISPRRSMTSSHSSQESRPSFDTSQFEMVSPKMGSGLSYPSHRLNHSIDSSAEGR